MRAPLGLARLAALLWLLAPLLLAGCEGKSFLLITLDSATPLSITAVDVTITNNGKTGRATLGKSFSLPPPQDFAIELPDDRRGLMQIELVARDGTTEVARGSATVTVAGGKTELSITLSSMDNPGADLRPVADLTPVVTVDLAGVDAPIVDDLMPAAADLATVTEDLTAAPPADLTATPVADLTPVVVADLALPPSEDLSIPEDLMPAADLLEVDLLQRDLLPAADLRLPVLAFEPGQALTVPDARWVAIANLDSLLGIDIVYVDANGVHYQLGLGDGTFASSVSDVPGMTGAGFERVAVGELNGDSDNDVAATRTSSDTKVYVSKTTTGVLGTAATIVAGAAPTGLVIGNQDASGLDLFVTSTPGETDGLHLLAGAGDGTFAAAAPFATCVDPADAAGADLNNDGRTDVAVACTGESVDMTRKPAIHVRLTDTAGLSTTTRLLSDSSERGFAGVAIGNVVGDSALDVIGACPDCSQVQIFPNLGVGTFDAPQPFAVGDLNLPSTVAVGDVDGDGDLDLVVGGKKQAAGTGGIAVLLGDGAGNFAAVTAAQRFATDLTVLQVLIVDLDGDGLAEIVMVTTSGIAILHNTTT